MTQNRAADKLSHWLGTYSHIMYNGDMEVEPGKLYLVSTPIGNLDDITLRALEVLKQADVVLAEDTREMLKLLTHFEIKPKKLLSYREQNHNRISGEILDLLKRRKSVALASDRGTPIISDPGYLLVRDAIDEDVDVVPIPGASAVLAALVASGAPALPFAFIGFLPRKGNKRKKIINKFGDLDITFIIYESKFRVKKTLKDIYDLIGDRQIAICNELTKKGEIIARGRISEALDQLPDKLAGEFTLVLSPT